MKRKKRIRNIQKKELAKLALQECGGVLESKEGRKSFKKAYNSIIKTLYY